MVKKEGYVTESNLDLTVVLDGNLDEGLIEEGFVREIISKLQTMRKEADFEVTDHIKVYYSNNDKIASIIEKNQDEIMADVLANELVKANGGFSKDWNINSEMITLGVEKI